MPVTMIKPGLREGKVIPINEPLLDGNEKKYLIECIETGWISSEGPFVAEFEKKFAKRVDRRFGIAVSNGTAALEAALAALKLEPGDEVILPSFTIISCTAAVIRVGAVPVLTDCDPVTMNMEAAAVEAKITTRTKAIMIVHIYGLPVDLDPILSLAEKHDLKVIEDAAQMHGQTYKDRPCGSFGDMSTFSFYPNKHVTTGEGGMIVTNDKNLAERCRSLRNLCFQAGKRFVHEELGYNFRMTNLQAAVGLAQLERLDTFIERKRAIGRRYAELLASVGGLRLPLARTDYAENIYWVYGLVLDDDVSLGAADVMRFLAERNVGSRPFFWPMHEQPVFREKGLFRGDSYPNAEKLARRGFYIPSGLALKDEQIVRVAEVVREIMALAG